MNHPEPNHWWNKTFKIPSLGFERPAVQQAEKIWAVKFDKREATEMTRYEWNGAPPPNWLEALCDDKFKERNLRNQTGMLLTKSIQRICRSCGNVKH